MNSDFSMDVEGLFQVGRTHANRSQTGASGAKGVEDGIVGAQGRIGHNKVFNGLRSFHELYITNDVKKLPQQITSAGNNISNTSSTARSGDNEAGRAAQQRAITTNDTSLRINRSIQANKAD